jgi:peptide/nickel transport system ATP-binding protein/oligopeptide transport system ATP-binding protein
MEILMAADNLCRIYKREGRRETVLSRVSLQLHTDEMIGIAGLSGSGKSTLMRLLAQEETADAGTVSLWPGAGKGRDRYRHIQMVLQDTMEAFSPRMTIGDFLREPLRNFSLIRGQAAGQAVREILKETGLPLSVLSRLPHELSGGQRQRAVLAGALLVKPEIILFDEPTSAVDMTTQKRMLLLIKRLREQYHFSGIFVSHDLAAVQQMSDRILIMDRGRIAERIESGDLRSACHPASRRLLAARLPDEGTDLPDEPPDGILCRSSGGRLWLETDPESVEHIQSECREHEITAGPGHRVLAYIL